MESRDKTKQNIDKTTKLIMSLTKQKLQELCCKYQATTDFVQTEDTIEIPLQNESKSIKESGHSLSQVPI